MKKLTLGAQNALIDRVNSAISFWQDGEDYADCQSVGEVAALAAIGFLEELEAANRPSPSNSSEDEEIEDGEIVAAA